MRNRAPSSRSLCYLISCTMIKMKCGLWNTSPATSYSGRVWDMFECPLHLTTHAMVFGHMACHTIWLNLGGVNVRMPDGSSSRPDMNWFYDYHWQSRFNKTWCYNGFVAVPQLLGVWLFPFTWQNVFFSDFDRTIISHELCNIRGNLNTVMQDPAKQDRICHEIWILGWQSCSKMSAAVSGGVLDLINEAPSEIFWDLMTYADSVHQEIGSKPRLSITIPRSSIIVYY